jgi:hypothetical protein
MVNTLKYSYSIANMDYNEPHSEKTGLNAVRTG